MALNFGSDSYTILVLCPGAGVIKGGKGQCVDPVLVGRFLTASP